MEKKEISFIKAEPKARLIAFTPKAYDLSVASARTCYSPELIELDSVTEGQRERIGKLIYEAGHHTPFQHPFFVFGLENVSRQLVWSFLHSHPFFNSDQSSQRYNVLEQAKVFVPEMNAEQEKIFKKAVMNAWNSYNELSSKLFDAVMPSVKAIGKIKAQSEKKMISEAEKKAVEWARYVLPVASYTCLYHAVNGITLQRYIKMMNSSDAPEEAKIVVKQMIEEIKKIDADFIERIENKEFGEKELIEEKLNEKVASNSEKFAEEFDSFLDGKISKLRSSTPEAEKVLAESVRGVLALTKEDLPDEKAVSMVLNPKENPYLLETLNVWAHSPLMRSLFNVNFCFYTKISHAGDSQNQRHRGTPASRPLLFRHITSKPDFIIPEVMHKTPEIKELYLNAINSLWNARNELIDSGLNEKSANYLLPNATSIRLIESGQLIHWLHKWRMRTCFNAQSEIWMASMQQLEQVREKHPLIANFIGPPCFTRKGSVEEKELEGPCPEGAHWCGVKVWLNYPKVKRIW
ncbi:MAG: FAD-dependent thymidylate synthase [Candidatus Diapherotrites archaeon]